MAARSAPHSDVAPPRHPDAAPRLSDAVVVLGVGVAFVAIVLLLAAVANGGNRHTRPSLVAPETTAPMRQAESWLAANLRDDQRVVVDAAAGQELVAQGLKDRQVVEIPVSGSLVSEPSRWDGSTYLVSGPDLRARIQGLPELQSAIEGWTAVAAFGGDADRVEIRRITAGSAGERHEQDVSAQALRLRAGGDLADNPNVTASPDALSALRSGQVDERVLSVLATFSVTHELHITGFPTIEGEDVVGMPRRVVEIDRIDDRAVAVDGSGLSPFETYLDAQRQSYRPVSVITDPDPSGDSVIRVTYAA